MLTIDRQYEQIRVRDRAIAIMTYIAVALASALSAVIVGIVFYFMGG